MLFFIVVCIISKLPCYLSKAIFFMNLPDTIKSLTKGFTPVIDSSISQKEYVKIDLSEENEALQKMDITSAAVFQDYIAEFLKKKMRKWPTEVI